MAKIKNNEKQVKQSTFKKNFYLIIYNYLKSEKTIQDILYDYNISKQKLQYYINRLKESKIIKKIGYGTWIIINQLDPKKVKIKVKQSTHDTLSKTKILSNEIRGHGFMYKLKLPKIPNWDKKSNYMDKNNIKYDNIHSNGQKIIIMGKKVHLFNNSIIVYDKYSYISLLAKETKSLAVYNFQKIIKRIETMFKINLKINGCYKFRVLKEHYGLMKNRLARQYNKEGNKLHVYNSDGLWLMIDNSFNLNELEVQKNRSPDENKAIQNTEGMQEYFNSHERTGFKYTPEVMADFMMKVTNNQLIFDNNMKSHLDVLDRLGKAVDKLSKKIDEKQ